MKSLLRTADLDKDTVLEIFAEADKMYETVVQKKKLNVCDGKILASLFFEPSTRTRLSTETAMIRLGGSVITVTSEEVSSLKKGETLADTANVVSRYADVIALRHYDPASINEFSKGATVPVINCGNGPDDHPTQSLLDAYTIFKQYGRIDGLTIAYVGDLKNSRTTHGLMQLLSLFGGKCNLISPEILKLPSEYRVAGLEYQEFDSLEECVKGANVICSSRIQIERFTDLNEYEKVKDYFVLTRDFLEKNAPEAILMHPLPRIYEIPIEVDSWKGAKYFDAVTNGVAVRMAVIKKMLCS